MGEAKTVRLRNVNSGAVVETREDKVGRLGSEWESADAKAPAKKAAAKKATSSNSND